MSSKQTPVFRVAIRSDVLLILNFIKGLAEYEKMLTDVTATPELLEYWLFDKQAAEVLFAVVGGKEVGFALYFSNFSTFLGKAGLYLEDLFVLPKYRGLGIGKALLVELARVAVERGYGRMEWSVLDWNKPSIDFYRSIGAVDMSEWTTYRLTEEAIARLMGDF
jgi:GNAT superfamily N-acetyltransferase